MEQPTEGRPGLLSAAGGTGIPGQQYRVPLRGLFHSEIDGKARCTPATDAGPLSIAPSAEGIRKTGPHMQSGSLILER
jgi:hypothetical protein